MLSMATMMLLIATKVTNFQTSKSDLHAQFQDSYLIRSNISRLEETKNNVRFSVVRHATTLIPRFVKIV